MTLTVAYLPACSALLGGLWAMSWAMVHMQSATDRSRVSLDQSVLLALLGMVGGCLFGWILKRLCREWPLLPRFVSLFLPALMAGSIAAPFGWLFRDHREDWSGVNAMTQAAMLGFVVVFVLSMAAQFGSRSHR